MDFYNEKLELNVPEHIAIILDGNGRWAKKRLLPRNAGHLQGSKVLERICDDAIEIGLKYLTVYVFSTENWNRPKEEVDFLMNLFILSLDFSYSIDYTVSALAGVMELADVLDSKSSGGDTVPVRPRPPAPKKKLSA